MKIAIYFYNKNINNVDCTNILEGNPGIGGTEYCILCLCELLKIYHLELKVTLITPCEFQLVSINNREVVEDICCVPKKAKEIGADILLISSVIAGSLLPEQFFINADKEQIRVITWGHNYYLSDYCNIIANYNCVRANVFVGKQQYDRYFDHSIIKKSVYIFNMYPLKPDEKIERNIQDNSVAYIGSLVNDKGFHILAKAWKKIIKAVPDANLFVIGNGQLYNRNAELGSYGIADKQYEDKFLPYLIDVDGKILKSVHFLGTVGKEKKEIIKSICVGVVNPTGRTETFGLSALDFESMKVPVVTIEKGGFLDTVINNQTGLLYNKATSTSLADCVIKLLKDTERNLEYGENGRELAKQFSGDKIVEQWVNLFELVIHEEPISLKMPENFKNKQLKWLRILNRKLKDSIGIEYLPAVIDIETIARKLYRKICKK